MTKKKQKRGADQPQRRHERVALDLLVQVRSDSVAQFRAVHAKNLSAGGMFIAVDEGASGPVRTVGSQLYFQFTVKDGGILIEGLGKVVHASAAGFGIEFVSLLEPSASIVRALVAERATAS